MITTARSEMQWFGAAQLHTGPLLLSGPGERRECRDHVDWCARLSSSGSRWPTGVGMCQGTCHAAAELLT